MRRGPLAGDIEAVGLHVVIRDANEARHLAGMRRDDHIAPFAARQRARIAAEGVQTVSIDDAVDTPETGTTNRMPLDHLGAFIVTAGIGTDGLSSRIL